ncbi:MAG: FAD-dependent oxidoreductase [Acidimicrobiia bacterium]|nr:FAD-dependent oxidoreductase [Acidimicrobiia bacterium]
MAQRTSRRAFLGAGSVGVAAAALGLLAGCGTGTDRQVSGSPPARGRRVVVVGAGLAGLVAAQRMAAGGMDVTVLEARERVGGRTWTLRDGFGEEEVDPADAQHADAGGEFVDADHVRLQSLVGEMGLALDPVGDRGEDLVVRRGVALSSARFAAEHDMDAAAMAVAHTVLPMLRDIDPADAPASEHAARYDATSVGEFLTGLDISEPARWMVARTLIDEFTVPLEDLSLLAFLQVAALNWELDDDEREGWRIRGGSQQICERLARGLDRVETGAALRRVEQRGDVVVAHTEQAAYTADHLVLATPLPPLRTVSFDEPPPDRVRQAIAELGYGVGGKTMLRYPHRFWRDADWSGSAVTDLGIGSLYEAHDAQPGTGGILSTYTAGEAGVAAAAIDAADRMAAAGADIAELAALAGIDRSPAPSGARSVMWQTEAASGGTYTAYRPGQVTALWRALRQPFGRVHLAGEHTDTYTGYMEGAVRSGERVAERILGG